MKRFLLILLLFAAVIPAQAGNNLYSHHYSTAANATSTSPAGTTSTTGVVMGVNATLTPLYTGAVLFIISGDITNNAGGDGGKVQIYYGTGSAPTNGTTCSTAGTRSEE